MPDPEHGRRPLTAVARQALAEVLRPGLRAIDATVGNGHDTLFLAQAVGPGGRVVGLDVQAAAIARTRSRLEAAGLADRVELHLRGHQELVDLLPAAWRGSVSAVMFNLGYLPGSNKAIVTRPATTLRGLSSAAAVLGPSGLLSVIVYPDHAGGGAEAQAIAQWVAALPGAWRVRRYRSPGPLLYLIGHHR